MDKYMIIWLKNYRITKKIACNCNKRYPFRFKLVMISRDESKGEIKLNNEINVKTKLEAKDVKEFNLAYSSKSRALMGVILFIFYLTVMIIVSERRDAEYIILLGGIAVVISFVSWFLNKKSVERRSGKAFSMDKSAQMEQKYLISENNINYESESGSGDIKWSEIHKVTETKNLFLIFVSTNRTLIIPKNSFISEKETTTFRYFIKKNIPLKPIKFML